MVSAAIGFFTSFVLDPLTNRYIEKRFHRNKNRHKKYREQSFDHKFVMGVISTCALVFIISMLN